MDAHLELLAAFLVDMRAFDDRKGALAGRQRDWAGQCSAGAQSGVDDLLGSLVDYFVVICLQANADPLALFLLGLSHASRTPVPALPGLAL